MPETPSLRLPPELWAQILENLGSSLHRNELQPLLTTSHIFYEKVAPMVYETIVFHGYNDHHDYTVGPWVSGPSTCVHTSHVHCLLAALKNSPRLAQMVTALIDLHPIWMDFQNPTQYILPRLVNLRRLHITQGQDSAILALPPSTALTHLSTPCLDGYSPSLFETFLASQRKSLAHLCMDFSGEGFLPFSTSPMTALHTFTSDCPLLLDQMVDIARIKHLSLMTFCPPWTQDPVRAFSSLVSLKIMMIFPIDAMQELGQYFESLRLLHVSLSPSKLPVPVNVEHFLTIASSTLSYICFDGTEASSEHLGVLWHRYPSLQVVDLAHRESLGPPVSRHFRDCKMTQEVFSRPASVFEAWWEPLKDDLGYLLDDI